MRATQSQEIEDERTKSVHRLSNELPLGALDQPMAGASNLGKVSRYGAHDDTRDDCPCRECRHRRMAELHNDEAESAVQAVGFWILIGLLLTVLGLAIKALG